MIDFINNNQSYPYVLFRDFYSEALKKSQKNIEAICISSYDSKINEVQARFVNLNYIKNEEWIFFSNYKSPKAKSFENHNQITASFFWNTTYTQVRIKAKISKTDENFSDYHFNKRSIEKNALAISSDQSQQIDSYKEVKNNYEKTIKNIDSSIKRPNYWGGYSFKPYYFEFWQGNEKRLNERTIFEYVDGTWKKYFLQP